MLVNANEVSKGSGIGKVSNNSKTDENVSYDGNDTDFNLLQCDWLADSAMMSHITNQKDALIDY